MSLVILLENSAGGGGGGGGGGVALVLTSYQYFRSHFLNQCSREKMENKQTKNKTKQKQIHLKLSSLPYFRLKRLKIFTKIQTRRVQKPLFRFVGAQPRCLDYMKENLQGTHQLRPQGLSLEMWEAPYHGEGNPGDLGGWLTIQPCFLRTYLAIEGSHMTFFVDARSGFYLAAIFKVCGQMVRGLEMGLLAGLEQSKFSNYPIACGKIQMATVP